MPSTIVVIAPDGSEHTRYLYSRKKHGPNCQYCRQANAAYIAWKKDHNKDRTETETARYHAEGGQGGIPSIPHGKASGHEWHGCNQPCCITPARERWRTTVRKRRLRQRIQAQTTERIAVNG